MLELKVKALEKALSFEILASLMIYGGQNKKNLYASISNSKITMQRRLEELEKLGLVEIDRQIYNKNIHFVTLTDAGKKIAEKILEVEVLIHSLKKE